MSKYYEFFNPVKIISGMNSIESIGFEMERFEAKKPFIISEKNIHDLGHVSIIEKILKDYDIITGGSFYEVPADSSVKVVNQISELYNKNNCDSIIAIGGGSVIDTAKGVNILVSHDSRYLEEFSGSEFINKKLKPLFVVPTTSGTGSEATLVAVIADQEKNIKLAFNSYCLVPDVAFLDPRMTVTLPEKLTASTAMDALTHAIEAFIGLQKNPVSDSFALTAIKLIRDNLMDTLKDGRNKEKRLALAEASLIAGVAFSNSMVGIVHSIGHAIGGVCHVHHGTAMAILLPVCLEYTKQVNGKFYTDLLYNITDEETFFATEKEKRTDKFIKIVEEMNEEINKKCGMPIKLSQAGVKREHFEEIAAKALNDGSITNNRQIFTKEDIIKILEKAL